MYFSTNWRANTEKGMATVVGAQYNVSGEDNLLTLKLDGTELASVRGDARQYICSASGLQAILYADSAGLYAVFCDTDGLWGQPLYCK